MTTPEPTLEQIAQLQHDVAVLAWLHAGLVHEINLLVGQLMGATTGDPARAAAIRARAARIARIRANPDPTIVIRQ